MTDKLVVVLNDQSQLEYDRSKPLSPQQAEVLERMDRKMDQGIEIAGRSLPEPNPLQRAQFVALQLVQAVQAGEDNLAAATCSYLADRVPDLQQVSARQAVTGLHIDLVFDRPFMNETRVEFFNPRETH